MHRENSFTLPAERKITTACPECHTLHTTSAAAIGSHLWNLCDGCAQHWEQSTLAILRERGITLETIADLKGGA